jgi:hypothetical protein
MSEKVLDLAVKLIVNRKSMSRHEAALEIATIIDLSEKETVEKVCMELINTACE